MRKNYPNVIWDYPRYPDGKRITMFNLIEKTGFPPTRIIRFCCSHLKETSGKKEFVSTGVRWAESANRKRRGMIEKQYKSREQSLILNSDNDETRRQFETCQLKGKKILNPLVAWQDSHIWNYIKKYNLKYCCLYDEGWKRIGCIGCPMARYSERVKMFECYPRFKALYMHSFKKILNGKLKNFQSQTPEDNYKKWQTPEDIFDWWISK
jgi:phosphoadenosine phosphosulfate reductase